MSHWQMAIGCTILYKNGELCTQITACVIGVPWSSSWNGTKTEVARSAPKIECLSSNGQWHGHWEYIHNTPWPPIKAMVKAGWWVSD